MREKERETKNLVTIEFILLFQYEYTHEICSVLFENIFFFYTRDCLVKNMIFFWLKIFFGCC